MVAPANAAETVAAAAGTAEPPPRERSLGPGLPGSRRTTSRLAAPVDAARRFTYVLLLRVVLTAGLLVAAIATDLAAAGQDGSPWSMSQFPPIMASFALSVAWAVLLRRGAPARRLALYQSTTDLVVASLLLHADGSADSGAVLWYLLVVGGAAAVVSRRATAAITVAACVAYLGVSLLDRQALLPAFPGRPLFELPLSGTFLFVAVRNAVFFIATAALTRRLAGELETAGARIAVQDARLDELLTLHADVVRSLSSGLLTVSARGVVRSVNPAGAEILGASPMQLEGRPITEAVPELAACLAAQPAPAPARRAEIALRRPDGTELCLGLSVSPLLDASGAVMGRIVNFQDLTELRTMEERADRAERLAAIGRLAAGVAHEIRNPLAAISGSIELLHATEAQGENRELMDIVMREVDRLNRLITELLDYARPQRPETARLELGTTLAEILRVLEHDRRVGAGLTLVVDEPVWVEADPNQLRQIVFNLLLNAADASPPEAPIEVRVARRDDWALLVVRDHGPGVPSELRARIFEPFFSTKKGGTGLGLPTVHRIVEQHGGTITLDDAPGGGTRFSVRLPAAAPPT